MEAIGNFVMEYRSMVVQVNMEWTVLLLSVEEAEKAEMGGESRNPNRSAHRAMPSWEARKSWIVRRIGHRRTCRRS